MITIGEMQISGMLTMVMLALMLVLRVPNRAKHHSGFARARWLAVAGTLLIALQFLLQYMTGLRQMGVTQAVLLNLLFFMPASLFIGLAVLSVQRRGRVTRKEWTVGTTLVVAAAVMLLTTVYLDGVPLQLFSPALQLAEYVGALLFLLLMFYLFILQYREYRRLQQAVDEYYDRERKDLLRWMGLSVSVMPLFALFIPFVIFFHGLPLVVFSVCFFFFVFYIVISLYSYGISEDSGRVEEAEGSEEVTTKEESGTATTETTEDNAATLAGHTFLDNEQQQHIEQELRRWAEDGGSRQHNLTLSIVSRQINVPMKRLQLWLRQSEHKKLTSLMNYLRVEDAKNVIAEHPDWSSESIADYCGFSSRQYFHQMFVQYTGTTPAKYQKQTPC